jgi:hypothetical protein
MKPRGRITPASLLALVVLCAAGTSCRIAPPDARVVARRGLVRAPTLPDAHELARLLDEYYPRVKAALPSTRDRAVEVWSQEELGLWRFQRLPPSMTGFVDEESGRIHLLASGRCAQQTLCHELVHALLDESWSPLPVVIEEGICEHVSFAIVGGCSELERTNMLLATAKYLNDTAGRPELRAVITLEFRAAPDDLASETVFARFPAEFASYSSPIEALQTARNSVSIWTGEARILPYHYGLGAWIVSRIAERHGIERIHALCVDAAREGRTIIALDELLAAAELGEPSTWFDAILPCFREDDLRRLALGGLDGILDRAAAWLAGVAPSGLDENDILDRVRIIFRLEVGGPAVDLLADLGVRKAVMRRLEEREAGTLLAMDRGPRRGSAGRAPSSR